MSSETWRRRRRRRRWSPRPGGPVDRDEGVATKGGALVVAPEAVSDAVKKLCFCLVPHVHTQGSARPSEPIPQHYPFVSSSFPAFRLDPAHPTVRSKLQTGLK